ncbi:MAG: hypothetical protein COA45_06560 [Zetaproteobacteria bacterium]|nr:MAG: hypothetical protein COA45_06560 [Zetaproteobacteria bacterium]
MNKSRAIGRVEMMFKNFKRVFLLSVMIILHSSNSYACAFVSFPYDLKNEYDLLFTAKAKSCNTINGQGYLNLSVERIWKGKDKQNYTLRYVSCTEPYWQIDQSFMLVANYMEDEKFIKRPFIIACGHAVIEIEHNALGLAKTIWEHIEFKVFYKALNVLLDPNFGLGEPLYDYRKFGSLGSAAYYYINVLVLIGFLILILLSPLYVFRIAKRNAKRGKTTKGTIQIWSFFVIIPAILVLTIVFSGLKISMDSRVVIDTIYGIFYIPTCLLLLKNFEIKKPLFIIYSIYASLMSVLSGLMVIAFELNDYSIIFKQYMLTVAVLFAILIFILHIKSMKKPETNQDDTRNLT